MQVQKISSFNYDRKNSIRKTNNISKTPSFKSYGEIMESVVKRDLKNVNDVSLAFTDLLKALKSTNGVKINPELSLLESNELNSIADFIKRFSAPIAEVPSSLRDLIFKSQDSCITLLEKENEGCLTMYNFGKFGFLNALFNSQDARHDIKFVFTTPVFDSFEVGVTKKGDSLVEQIHNSKWIKSEYGAFDRISKESGIFETTPAIW